MLRQSIWLLLFLRFGGFYVVNSIQEDDQKVEGQNHDEIVISDPQHKIATVDYLKIKGKSGEVPYSLELEEKADHTKLKLRIDGSEWQLKSFESQLPHKIDLLSIQHVDLLQVGVGIDFYYGEQNWNCDSRINGVGLSHARLRLISNGDFKISKWTINDQCKIEKINHSGKMERR
jgi:hypothetical protein